MTHLGAATGGHVDVVGVWRLPGSHALCCAEVQQVHRAARDLDGLVRQHIGAKQRLHATRVTSV